jgi:hypothetical protein
MPQISLSGFAPGGVSTALPSVLLRKRLRVQSLRVPIIEELSA